MKVIYYIYKRESGTPYFLRESLPADGRKCFSKFTGKKAKIEAISRLMNVTLSDKMTDKEIRNYITENLYRTPQYQEYKKILNEVQTEIKTEYLELIGVYEIEIMESMKDINNVRLLPFIKKRILNQDLYVKGKDPIISFIKL